MTGFTTLVLAFGGLVHKNTCYSLKGRELYKVIASEIPETEAAAFVQARKLEPCRACLRREAKAS